VPGGPWWFIAIHALGLCWAECHWKKEFFFRIFPFSPFDIVATIPPHSSSFPILFSPGAELNGGHFRTRQISFAHRPQHSTGQKESPTFVVKKIYSNFSFVFLLCIINIYHQFTSLRLPELYLMSTVLFLEGRAGANPGILRGPLNFSVPLRKFTFSRYYIQFFFLFLFFFSLLF